MNNVSQKPCGTFQAGAPVCRFPSFPDHPGAAFGTGFGHPEFLLAAVSPGFIHLDDLGYDIPGLSHPHGIPYAYVFFLDVIHVMKRCPADGGSCQLTSVMG